MDGRLILLCLSCAVIGQIQGSKYDDADYDHPIRSLRERFVQSGRFLSGDGPAPFFAPPFARHPGSGGYLRWRLFNDLNGHRAEGEYSRHYADGEYGTHQADGEYGRHHADGEYGRQHADGDYHRRDATFHHVDAERHHFDEDRHHADADRHHVDEDRHHEDADRHHFDDDFRHAEADFHQEQEKRHQFQDFIKHEAAEAAVREHKRHQFEDYVRHEAAEHEEHERLREFSRFSKLNEYVHKREEKAEFGALISLIGEKRREIAFGLVFKIMKFCKCRDDIIGLHKYFSGQDQNINADVAAGWNDDAQLFGEAGIVPIPRTPEEAKRWFLRGLVNTICDSSKFYVEKVKRLASQQGLTGTFKAQFDNMATGQQTNNNNQFNRQDTNTNYQNSNSNTNTNTNGRTDANTNYNTNNQNYN